MVSDKTSIATYATSLGVAGGSWTVNELAALGGLLIAALTFLLNVYFKLRHLRIAERAAVKGPPNDHHPLAAPD